MTEVSIFALQPSLEGIQTARVIVAAQDPGAAQFLGPVLPHLAEETSLQTIVISAGHATEYLNNFPGIELEPLGNPKADAFETAASLEPTLIVAGTSAQPEVRTGLAQTFPDAPLVVAEDYYVAAGDILERALAGEMRMPDRIFAMDKFAKQELVRRYGHAIVDLASRIAITGQPAFDYLADTDAIKREREAVRKVLELDESAILISCFTTIGATGLAGALANELGGTQASFSLAFNKHPRDPANMAAYLERFRQAGVTVHNTEGLSSRQLIAAADLVAVLPYSTLSLHAIRHGIPTVHVGTDPNSLGASQVPVVRGASPYASPAEFWPLAQKLLDPTHPTARALHRQMERLYPVDGGSAARVAASICKLARAA